MSRKIDKGCWQQIPLNDKKFQSVNKPKSAQIRTQFIVVANNSNTSKEG